ncbi:hypothetical protein [Rhodococcus sp. JS3073]|uniref:hypothetical protein n=1 Tax=Rhodococcus sp. JS3073 TaxID=3002901 RepID=UPI0022855166|nr:hypothetical protein [Rhodococcus sp. JS3073]WAM19215.1 hypothetical protein OYT95_42590 [Rhodococcus sp. JS3073]
MPSSLSPTAAESLNRPRRAARLLEQWLAHSALLRIFMLPADHERLWPSLVHPCNPALGAPKITRASQLRWVQQYDLLGADEKPLKIHRARIRTAHHAIRGKRTWTGGGLAAIDPTPIRPSRAITI